MKHGAWAGCETSAAFGKRAREDDFDLEVDLSNVLDRRLRQKIMNYERAARKLQVSGQTDAADALKKAASRLRHITISAP
ncbi:MAG: hypothetical protein R3C42_04640 [Parvularculaceae bacterium]|nr:hypothetical protein [Parvularculaceae bacterium]